MVRLNFWKKGAKIADDIAVVGGKNIDNIADLVKGVDGSFDDIVGGIAGAQDDIIQQAIAKRLKNLEAARAVDAVPDIKPNQLANLDDAATGIAKGVPNESASGALAKSKQFIKNNPKMIVGGLTVTAIATAALILFNQKNNTEFTIVKMQLGGQMVDKNKKNIKLDANEILISYKLTDPEAEDDDYFDFETFDQIELTSNDSVPLIPLKNYDIQRVNNLTRQFTIKISANDKPTTLGNAGTFKYKTDFANQLKFMTKEAAEFTGETFGSAADSFAGGLGIDPSTIKWVGIGLAVFFVVLIGIFIALKFM